MPAQCVGETRTQYSSGPKSVYGQSPTVREDTNAATTRAPASSRRSVRLPPAPSAFLLVNDVKDRLSEINRELRRKAATLGPRALIGSTVAVLLVLGNQGCCMWAGDSRLYRLRAGQLRQLSHDHSYVQNLVDCGEIGPEAAATHPLSNIVTNLVGGADELLLEERRHALEPGDVMLLCSDGLSGAVSDIEIAAVLSARPAQNAADGLIDLALAKRTRDNVSVVVIEYGV